ncbi:hypothetical protein [Pseudomonas putida]|uniref:hypothetical protein n=1 Tax=Pseudomonas putida TaxID=303 RepID=UPI0035A45A7D
MPEEIVERFTLLAKGLAEHWDVPMTSARRQKLRDYVDWVVSDFREEVKSGGKMTGWDGELGGLGYVCDYMSDRLWDWKLEWDRNGEVMRSKLGNQIQCCIRAALDIAVEPSAGVIGFTAGDLRKACGGELPDWIATAFTPPLSRATPDDLEIWT